MVFKKIFFQNTLMACETSPPPLFMENATLNFHFLEPIPNESEIRPCTFFICTVCNSIWPGPECWNVLCELRNKFRKIRGCFDCCLSRGLGERSKEHHDYSEHRNLCLIFLKWGSTSIGRNSALNTLFSPIWPSFSESPRYEDSPGTIWNITCL